MRKNAKILASLVRKAKSKLQLNKREEALELMRKAVVIDDNNGVLVQVIKVIGKKKPQEETREETPEIETLDKTPEVEAPDETPEIETLDETPEVEAPDETPEIEAPDETPDIETLEDSPDIETLEDSPEIETLEDSPEIETLEDSAEIETLEDAQEEEPVRQVSAPAKAAVENKQERKTLMASEDQLLKLFEASDNEFNNGHQHKAVAYMKRAKKLDPENPEVLYRVELVKIEIKSANLVSMARKKLEEGKASQAVELTRKAFSMMPATAGIDDLLTDIENEKYPLSSPSTDDDDPEIEFDDTEPEDYITTVRQMVQDNQLEKAASFALESYKLHPEDKLLSEFIDNFKKLGLLD